MAEVRKRNTKATESTPAASAKAPGPARSNNALYLVLAGAAALAVYYFNGPSLLSSSTSSGKLLLTDAQLAAYTGADPDKPILVALNGTIFDVSEGRSFYGPGGHYGHFAGRDATRAWVSTCFDPQYLTWDMKGVEAMFMPKWMDEEMEDALGGKSSEVLPDSIIEQMATLVKKVGKVNAKEKKRRREEDKAEVEAQIENAMKHWMDFFRNNPKYKEVGEVIGREPLPEDRPDIGLCEDALKKRPIKGGKFGSVMDQANAGGKAQEKKAPDFVKPARS